jgi:hypothetical protein
VRSDGQQSPTARDQLTELLNATNLADLEQKAPGITDRARAVVEHIDNQPQTVSFEDAMRERVEGAKKAWEQTAPDNGQPNI